MRKNEIICCIFIFIGLILMGVAYLDLISIVSSVLNKLFNFTLPDVFFNSTIFRGSSIVIGSIFLIVGGLTYKIT